MKLIDIDLEKCKKDGICIEECPFDLLVENADGIPEMAPGAEAVCMRCGHCIAVCPVGAVSLDGETAESCEAARKYPVVDEATMGALLKNRRSVRVFKNRPVPRETVGRLMDMVRWAPTAKNLQPVHWRLTDDREKIRKMARLTIECFRTDRMFSEVVNAWDAGEDMILRDAPLLAVAHAATDALKPSADCAIAAASLEIAATAYGHRRLLGGLFHARGQHLRSHGRLLESSRRTRRLCGLDARLSQIPVPSNSPATCSQGPMDVRFATQASPFVAMR